MPIAFVFWLIMGLWLFFSLLSGLPVWIGSLALFVLLCLVGWKVFGFPIQG